MTALLIAAMSVTFAEGPVTAKGAPVALGASLESGDVVQTGAGGRVEIALEGGSVLRLGENSRVRLGDSSAAKFSARLLLGNLWAKVHKLVAGESFQIETENAVAGVRGTEFRVEVAPEQDDLVRVYEGAVQVDSGKWAQRVEAGRELRFRRERDPGTARKSDAAADNGFMKWVRERKEFQYRNPEREHRREHRERRRER